MQRLLFLMIRVPSFIHAGEFQSLKIKDMTFVAYRNQDPPLRNEVFFEEHALIFVLEGEKKFVTPEQDIRVKKGNVVFIPRGYYTMQEAINKQYRSLVFFFNEKLLKEFVAGHLSLFQENSLVEPDPNQGLLVFGINESLEKYIDSIFPYFHLETQYLNHFLNLKLQELLLHLLEIDPTGKLKSIVYNIYKGEKADLEFLMDSYYLKPLSMEELSRLSGRSLSAFKRDFQKQFQTSPALWLKNKRLEHARLLLENTGMNVSEISMEIGYESVSHFIKAFKEKYYVTPSHYKEGERS